MTGPRPIDRQVLDEMCQTLVHRGPDDEGYFTDDHIALGHRRLSIIDLSTGHQPLANEDGTIFVVFNGEIYNFQELRKQTEQRGHRYRTKADTEVLVHLYEEYGTELVTHLKGMFAFVIWDQRRHRLVAARDHLGKKPFYYTMAQGWFVFASELKALLKHPAVPRAIDPTSLAKYLLYEFIPSPRTILKGVWKLPPGSLLIVQDGRVQVRRYWDIEIGKGPRIAVDEAVRAFHASLAASVRRRLMADVPLGAFLSGGIDSSSIVATMVALSPQPVKTFSIRFDDPSFDESRHARLAARALGTEQHERRVTAHDLLDLVPRLGDVVDEPLGDASIVPTHLLAKHTREHVTVALSGDGADELFAGYPTYLAHRWAGVFERIPGWCRHGLIAPLIRRLPVSMANMSWDFRLRRFLLGMEFPAAIRHAVWLGSCTPAQARQLLAPDVSAQVAWEQLYEEHERYFHAGGDQASPVERALAGDLHLYLAEGILTKVDRATMAASLEVRSPFLDVDLVTLVAGWPEHFKLHGFTTKALLKRAMRGIVPDPIRHRPKKGFGIPVARWLRRELRELAHDVLHPAKLEREGFFQPHAVATLLHEHDQGRQDHRKALWTLLVFELWYAQCLQPETPCAPVSAERSGA